MAKVRIFPSLNRKPVTDWKEFNDSAEVSCAFQATMEFGRPAGFQLDEEPAPAGCPGFGAGVAPPGESFLSSAGAGIGKKV